MLNIRTFQVSSQIVDDAYSNNTIELPEGDPGPVNSYAVLRDEFNEKHTALVQHQGKNQWARIRNTADLEVQGLRPRDARQAAMLNNLVSSKILVSVVIGQAGTGKTTLALAYALDEWFANNKKIILSKPTAMVGNGKAFGPVPGDMNEKYAPYLASYEIAMKRLLGSNGAGQLEMMKKKGALEYVPIELVRGSEFENCVFILDEAQNLTWHELKTIISRMGEGTTMIILGDLNQIDTGAWKEHTGLSKLINSPPYQASPVGAQIELLTQYRSPITALVADVDKWLNNAERANNK